jgi:hypothetical protein
VSRTATAPFDRLKIFLITRPPDLGGLAGTPAVAPAQGVKALVGAVARLYVEGGVRAFWVGQSALESQENGHVFTGYIRQWLEPCQDISCSHAPTALHGLESLTCLATGIRRQIYDV